MGRNAWLSSSHNNTDTMELKLAKSIIDEALMDHQVRVLTYTHSLQASTGPQISRANPILLPNHYHASHDFRVLIEGCLIDSFPYVHQDHTASRILAARESEVQMTASHPMLERYRASTRGIRPTVRMQCTRHPLYNEQPVSGEGLRGTHRQSPGYHGEAAEGT